MSRRAAEAVALTVTHARSQLWALCRIETKTFYTESLVSLN